MAQQKIKPLSFNAWRASFRQLCDEDSAGMQVSEPQKGL
jgi:hypothetical protein